MSKSLEELKKEVYDQFASTHSVNFTHDLIDRAYQLGREEKADCCERCGGDDAYIIKGLRLCKPCQKEVFGREEATPVSEKPCWNCKLGCTCLAGESVSNGIPCPCHATATPVKRIEPIEIRSPQKKYTLDDAFANECEAILKINEIIYALNQENK